MILELGTLAGTPSHAHAPARYAMGAQGREDGKNAAACMGAGNAPSAACMRMASAWHRKTHQPQLAVLFSGPEHRDPNAPVTCKMHAMPCARAHTLKS